jgi:hypothetical protein
VWTQKLVFAEHWGKLALGADVVSPGTTEMNLMEYGKAQKFIR